MNILTIKDVMLVLYKYTGLHFSVETSYYVDHFALHVLYDDNEYLTVYGETLEECFQKLIEVK